ncbi:hypothetical protein BDV24DRAFT_170599 [Aspergillus arachidicola]|uniref:Uncharacterized protein n=1 Tax=Aspergillus arachidicola TaxID=656916 RepID=A0A5N6XMZ3_9EURO|nr:hypothetical protein BDV24DRAFT_170599 [Aspergillus arachidicola]
MILNTPGLPIFLMEKARPTRLHPLSMGMSPKQMHYGLNPTMLSYPMYIKDVATP